MLRYLTLLAVLSALSLPLRAQNVGAPIEKGQEAKDPTQMPGTEIGIPTEARWFAYRLGLAPRAVSKEEVGKAFILSTHSSRQEGPQQGTISIRFEPEKSGSLSDTIIPENYATPEAAQQTAATGNGHDGFHWSAALTQSLLFLGVQHGYAMTQAKTRRELRGPFFKDYFTSVSKLGGWEDGGRFFTNYISHPMQGSIAGFIQIQNDPHGIRQKFGKSRGYWNSRLKAMAWSAAYSIQFELGPISQSSIGNVGLHTSLDGKKRKMSYVDLVVTPTIGTAWLIGEDFLDRFVVRGLEAKINGAFLRNATRMLLNPMRGFANMLRFKPPWYRDR
jgi:hypothetical protein